MIIFFFINLDSLTPNNSWDLFCSTSMRSFTFIGIMGGVHPFVLNIFVLDQQLTSQMVLESNAFLF